jgi:hypothetical protein
MASPVPLRFSPGCQLLLYLAAAGIFLRVVDSHSDLTD